MVLGSPGIAARALIRPLTGPAAEPGALLTLGPIGVQFVVLREIDAGWATVEEGGPAVSGLCPWDALRSNRPSSASAIARVRAARPRALASTEFRNFESNFTVPSLN